MDDPQHQKPTFTTNPNVTRAKEHEHSPNTIKSYTSDWAQFCKWATERGGEYQRLIDIFPAYPVPVSVLEEYILDCSTVFGHKVSTITRRLSAIRHKHISNHLQPPNSNIEISRMMKATRRTGNTDLEQKAPIILDTLHQMLDALGYNTNHEIITTRTALSIGFHMAGRMSEVVSLRKTAVKIVRGGLKLHLESTKSGSVKKAIRRIPGSKYCPVAQLEYYLQEVRPRGPFVFPAMRGTGHLSARYYVDKIKELCESLGLDPYIYAGHSMRRGFITQGHQDGIPLTQLSKRAGHKNPATTFGYIADADWDDQTTI